MTRGFGENKSATANNVIAIDTLRAKTQESLTTAYAKLAPGAAFNKASSAKGEDSFLGGLIMNMLVGSVLAHAFAHSAAFHNIDKEILPHVTSSGLFEAGCMVRDSERHSRYVRLPGLYPEGRRQNQMEDGRKLNRRFNLVSGNDNTCFAGNPQAEIACMSKMLDMLDGLEKEGITGVRIGEKENAHSVLKEETASLKTSGFKAGRLTRRFA